MSKISRRFAIVLAALLALSLTLANAEPTSASPPTPTEFVPGEILVKFKPGTPAPAIANAHRQHGGQVKEVIPGIDVHVVLVPAGQEVNRVANYERNPNVAFAEVNGIYRAVLSPTDPEAGKQWQYDNTGQTGGKVGADIRAFRAWDMTTGNATVNIAILDTGIDQSHPDLASKIAQNVNFSSSPDVDDHYGHGTHVAGSAAAITSFAPDGGVGVAGTCPNCALFNVKVLGDDGGGSFSAIANGIRWAADNGAQVISLSLGGRFGSKTLLSAIDYAWGQKAILTCAAGNAGSKSLFYPAAYTNCIAVAATDKNDVKASFSNWGNNWVDVAAPGVSILSTAPDHANTIWPTPTSYGTISGTSMATPHVAGLAGLVWSTGLCGSDNACVRNRIQSRADRIGGTGKYWAHGRINAYNSVLP